MEQINKIELQGYVGTVRTNIVGDRMVANFSVATEYFYKSKDGSGISETMWHNVVWWAGTDTPEIHNISKGAAVYVCGRTRCNKYTSADGTEKQIYEVMASKVKLLKEE